MELGVCLLDFFQEDDLYRFVYNSHTSIVDFFSKEGSSVKVMSEGIEVARIKSKKLCSYILDRARCCLDEDFKQCVY